MLTSQIQNPLTGQALAEAVERGDVPAWVPHDWELHQIGTRLLAKVPVTHVTPQNERIETHEWREVLQETSHLTLPPVVQTHYKPPEARFQDLASAVAWIPLERHEPDPVALEVDKLRQMGLHATADLIAKGMRPKPERAEGALFDAAATVMVSKAIGKFLQLSRDELLALIQRHEKGDFGVNGNASDIEAQPSAGPALGPGIEAATAIKTGSGLIKSRWPHFYRRDRKYFATDGCTPRTVTNGEPSGHESSWVEAVTLLSPGREPATVIHSELG